MEITGLRDLKAFTERQNKVDMVRSLCPYLTARPLKVPGDVEPKSYEKGYWAAVNDVVKKLNSLAKES